MTPRQHMLTGGGGARLHVRDWGSEDAPAMLFLHGWAQHHMCWSAQAVLAEEFRVVAMDLRGHGASDKPEDPEAYANGALWAEDIANTIKALGLKKPLLVGWSYAGRVIGEYLTHRGDADIGGIVLAGAVMASGDKRPDWMKGPMSAGKIKGLASEDQPVLIEATRQFVAACTYAPMPPDVADRFLAFNMLCPPHARRSLSLASSDTRPAYGKLSCPLTIIHGAEDVVVSPAAAKDLAEIVPHAKLEIWEEIGHAPFIEAPERFNAVLRTAVQMTRETA